MDKVTDRLSIYVPLFVDVRTLLQRDILLVDLVDRLISVKGTVKCRFD